MATNPKYVADNRNDNTRTSNPARAQPLLARPPTGDDENNDYSELDGNIAVGAVGGGAPYGTYASSGRTTLTSNGDGKATHMLLQQGRRRSAYSDSDTENALDYKSRRTGPCRCCSRTCFGLWLIFVVVVIGFALAVASIVMYAFLVRDHLQQNVKQQAQQSLNTMYDQLVDNLRRAAILGSNGTAGVSRAQLISATADYYLYATTSTTPSPTTTTDNILLRFAYRQEQAAAETTTVPTSSSTDELIEPRSFDLAGVLSIADLANTATTRKPTAPAVAALRLPAPNPADKVGGDKSYASKISMITVPDPTKT